MATNPVSIATLPRDCSDKSAWNELVSRQKDFRLLSLRIAPDAFGSTYAREQQFTWDVWENRLTNMQATTFVAVPGDLNQTTESHDGPGVKEILQRGWLGQLVLIRMNQDDRAKLSASQSPWTALKGGETSEDALAHYHLNGMFVVPSAREQGIARKLVEHALIRTRPGGSITQKYTVIIWAKNEAARRTFESCGFKVIGEEMHQSGSQEQPRRELALMMEHGRSS
ncbi:60S ribosomal protein L10A [Botryosphaeria dothidea]